MSDSDTRVSVIVGACQRDPQRWAEFDSIYRPMLFAFVRSRGLDDSDANDVVQDIFVKLLGKIETYNREKYKFRTWLFAVSVSWRPSRGRGAAGGAEPRSTGNPAHSQSSSPPRKSRAFV